MWFPVRCAGCGAQGASPCARCVEALRAPPVLGAVEGVDEVLALVAYDGVAAPFLTGLKYRNARAALAPFGRAAALLLPPATPVTWAPTTDARRRQRGFDQAELIARTVTRAAGEPAPTRLLHRLAGPPQTGRSAAERLGRAPRFVACGPAPSRVVVVDDVCTTGATLGAAARALREAGSEVVVALVIGRTPSPAGVTPIR